MSLGEVLGRGLIALEGDSCYLRAPQMQLLVKYTVLQTSTGFAAAGGDWVISCPRRYDALLRESSWGAMEVQHIVYASGVLSVVSHGEATVRRVGACGNVVYKINAAEKALEGQG